MLELAEKIKNLCAAVVSVVKKKHRRSRPKNIREGFSEKTEHSFIHQSTSFILPTMWQELGLPMQLHQ